VLLGVNIDHVATLRQARYARDPGFAAREPDVLAAADACERAGAGGITAHLRADRRHIQDADIFALRARVRTKLNLEMGNTPEIVAIAEQVSPHEVCLVPEHRQEITTEGGLDAAGQSGALRDTLSRLHEAGVRVSLFIDPDLAQVEASAALGADMVELHTGAFANAFGVEGGADAEAELDRLIAAAECAHRAGLQVNAGHGINYTNIAHILRIPHLAELNIGHSIVSRAVFTGLEAAVAEMLRRMHPAGARGSGGD
jgi:pyridoxine 5-phosphate synthase